MTPTPEREALAEPWRGLHKRLIVLGAAIVAQRTWGERQSYQESGKQDDALAALALEARSIADALAHEAAKSSAPAPQVTQEDPVAVVGGSFQLLWLGGSSFSEHVRKHGIKVGTTLYAHPKEKQT